MTTQTIRFDSLEIEIEESADEVTYRFRGDVDEQFRQTEVPRIARPRIIFELDQINNFNSCGIREWIYFVKDVEVGGQLVFRRCSIMMVDQINMVPDSLGKGIIESFHAPYFCPCSGEVNVLIDVKTHYNQLIQKLAPQQNCAKCGKEMEFDALEESYFLFAESGMAKKAS